MKCDTCIYGVPAKPNWLYPYLCVKETEIPSDSSWFCEDMCNEGEWYQKREELEA